MTALPLPEPEAGAAPVRRLTPRLVLQGAAVTLLVLLAAIGLLGLAFHEQLTALGALFLERFGGWGVLLGWAVGDAFPNPSPHDLYLALAVAGGMPFGSIVAWAYAGSLVGTVAGYGLGVALGRTAWFHRRVERRYPEAVAWARRYGLPVVMIASFTPLRFAVVVNLCGALRLPFGRFLLAAQVRLLRIALFLWLIAEGLLSLPT